MENGAQSVCTTAFPSHEGMIGQLIRKTFTKDAVIDIMAMGHLFVADCIDRQEFIRDTVLEKSCILLCDRYAPSTGWAYQAEQHDIDFILAVQQRHRLMMPDFTFIIDVPPEVAQERVFKKRGSPINAVFERDDLAYMERLRVRYLAYGMTHANTILLDGQKPTEELVEEVLKIMERVELNHQQVQVEVQP
jgi:thymidylate kinase